MMTPMLSPHSTTIALNMAVLSSALIKQLPRALNCQQRSGPCEVDR